MAGRKKSNWKHLLVVFFATLLIAAIVGIGSELLMQYTPLALAWIFLLVIIGIHVGFDIIGIAATAATEAPHHARAANKVYGARQAVYLVRNADKVANYANDIVGDVTGTISGAIAASIVIELIHSYPELETGEIWLTTFMLALVASLTVTGKAIGKSFAIRESNEIIASIGRVLATWEKVTGRSFVEAKKKGGRKNGATRKD